MSSQPDTDQSEYAPLVAFADESYSDEKSGGFYILAATVMAAGKSTQAVREKMMELRPRPTVAKLHWKELEGGAERKAAVAAVAALDQVHVVMIGTPVEPRRQERARAACLRNLVCHLHAVGVSRLICEARTKKLDDADVRVVIDARYGLPKGTIFRVDHQPGAHEPALWCADIAAGAFRSRQLGDHQLWLPLEPQTAVYEVQTY